MHIGNFREISLVDVSVEYVSIIYIYIYICIMPLQTTAPAETATDIEPIIPEPSPLDTRDDTAPIAPGIETIWSTYIAVGVSKHSYTEESIT